MQSPKIYTHKAGRTYPQPHFYILNKGINSGKPLEQSCPNCFVFLFESLEEMDLAYWLVYGLWRAKAFHPYLRGSVIYFIGIDNLKDCFAIAKSKAETDMPHFLDSIQSLKKLEGLESQFLRNLKLIEEARRAVFYRYYNKRA